MNAVLPIAERMLVQYGEFYPLGAYLNRDGEITHVGAADDDTDHPKSRDLIFILRDAFQEHACANRCDATALVFDVLVSLPGSNNKADAIQVCLDHRDGYSAEVFFPYQLAADELVFGETLAHPNPMDRNGILGLVEEDSMVANTKPEQPLEFSTEGLHCAVTRFRVSVNGPQDPERGWLVNSPNIIRYIWTKADLFHVTLRLANLVHREAAIGNHLLERNPLSALLEILARGADCTAVLLSQLVIIVNHDFKQLDDGADLSSAELVNQIVGMLFDFGHHPCSLKSV